jgi:two-component system sensor histidine kinase UhpB
MQQLNRPLLPRRAEPSVRLRLLIVFLSLNMLAGGLACAAMIWNAREATRVEIRASLDLAERFVKETVTRLGPSTSGGTMLTNLPLHLNLRHVRIAILDNAGDVKALLPDDEQSDADDHETAPTWFARLLSITMETRHVPVVAESRRVGTVAIMGEPADEAAEVWQDITTLAIVTSSASLLIFVLFYFSVGRILDPLTRFAEGLRDLENGRYRLRLSRPRVREMSEIADRFNALATALEEAQQENRRLCRSIITIQDEERKQIAADLHNEFGQCLFTIKANASSIETLAAGTDNQLAASISERVESIQSITQRLQSMNRQLLKRLRPSAFGHASLAELLDDLIEDFRKHHRGMAFNLQQGSLNHSYGEAIDLSVYRCVQEALTNSVRHASAKAVEIQIDDRTIPAPHLAIEIRDDGQGVELGDTKGFGLRSMGERVRLLGGQCLIESVAVRGTRLSITLPHSHEVGREEVA